MQLTYIIDEDRRDLVNDIQNFKIDFKESNYNWIQARQYENSMRQAFVNVKYEDGTAFNLTGCNIVFEGRLPDKTSRIYDNRDGVILDPLTGQFRFDFPKQAFAIAGSYEQAFFRIMRDGDNVATLEFDMTVLADKVISGIVPADYITPFEDLYTQLESIVENAGADLQAALDNWNKKFQAAFDTVTSQMNTLTDNFKTNSQALLDEWKQKFSDAVKAWSDNYTTLTAAKNTLTEQYNTLQASFNSLQEQIEAKNLVTTDNFKDQLASNNVVTTKDLATTNLNGLQLPFSVARLAGNDLPRFAAYGYYGGAGIPQKELVYGVPDIVSLKFTADIKGNNTVVMTFSLPQLATLFPDFDVTKVTVHPSVTGKWVYLSSGGAATIGVQCLNTIFTEN
ncbi:phage baseplate upper protein [Lactiplantibacillus plantarum]|uniref:phage baseplate upper protein n=1 Tax=Lactiplantibacillus plantarum TaxID=1590 RepID=UPI001BC5126E|nr:BppU family phage baseplate upper protein [Lactiplantibacillus plantarum]MBS0938016.1 BppU family phage baseplate upper protein [Lactiplantibacillus plantarum]